MKRQREFHLSTSLLPYQLRCTSQYRSEKTSGAGAALAMELASSFPSHRLNFRSRTAINAPLLLHPHPCSSKSCHIRREKSCLQFALPETAASILVTSVAVGAAATLLAKRLKPSEPAATEALKVCEECDGSGLCSECKGEGYIFKKISDESAQKARMASKSASTRYTAGLPTKWTYCFKCSSARSCRACGGSGQVKL
ncbi:transmembrane protein [Rhynchospora pubera]|uniref:Transmembrane protein n=1 Tax=Rhynchospora pubera TaxID=906938 RepID=A0AAV8F3Z0_9POAL|nr:transmembrane protein [Rhynchospora pubera]